MAPNIRRPEVGQVAKLRKSKIKAIAHALRSHLKRERDKRPLAERLEELARQLKAEAGPNAREVNKEEIDELRVR
ncbi:MAG TPA: type II toxin-antitoxin system VapB family antitoxin [Roseiarcus sp.]|nr:type II toxin-antitoxin system VapB family antitoxin [Roseiarcus sp.]